jgi:hypothetical protein
MAKGIKGKRNKLGKVLKSWKGFNIRMETKSITKNIISRSGQSKGSQTFSADTGTVAIYAKKKLMKKGIAPAEGKSAVEVATAIIDNL